MLGIKPRFTDTELMAIKVLTGIYLKGLDCNGSDERQNAVKETLESIKEKVKNY